MDAEQKNRVRGFYKRFYNNRVQLFKDRQNDLVDRMKLMNDRLVISDALTWGAVAGLKDHLTWVNESPSLMALDNSRQKQPSSAIYHERTAEAPQTDKRLRSRRAISGGMSMSEREKTKAETKYVDNNIDDYDLMFGRFSRSSSPTGKPKIAKPRNAVGNKEKGPMIWRVDRDRPIERMDRKAWRIIARNPDIELGDLIDELEDLGYEAPRSTIEPVMKEFHAIIKIAESAGYIQIRKK